MTDRKTHAAGTSKTSDGNFAKDPLKDKIGGNLRKLYDDVVNEAVPDDFLALLAKADENESSEH